MLTVPAAAPPWAHRLASDIDREFARSTVHRAPVRMPSYPKAGLPSAADYPQTWIYVTDDIGGATPAFSDGTQWCRSADRAPIA